MRLIHRLILRRYGIPPGFVLNGDGTDARDEPSAAVAMAEAAAEPSGATGEPAAGPSGAAELFGLSRAMLVEGGAGGEDGLDYARLAAGSSYLAFLGCARRLRAFDPAELRTGEEKLAFWINLYNALVVDAIVRFRVRRSVREVPGFFWRAAYEVGGDRYCAFDIENGILRANAPHPLIPGPHFGGGDPRRRHALPRLDPRIHFALVCGSRSCPPIAVYEPQAIRRQLDLATGAFVNGGGFQVDPDCRRARLSRIFQWYAPDFGAGPLALHDRRPLLRFIEPHLKEELRRCAPLEELTVAFQPYDWTLNAPGLRSVTGQMGEAA